MVGFLLSVLAPYSSKGYASLEHWAKYFKLCGRPS
jgi:hypothetical protein